jgi:hypothetical protein
MTDLSKTPMALRASETSGTSPPPVYHFTTSAHLPRDAGDFPRTRS